MGAVRMCCWDTASPVSAALPGLPCRSKQLPAYPPLLPTHLILICLLILILQGARHLGTGAQGETGHVSHGHPYPNTCLAPDLLCRQHWWGTRAAPTPLRSTNQGGTSPHGPRLQKPCASSCPGDTSVHVSSPRVVPCCGEGAWSCAELLDLLLPSPSPKYSSYKIPSNPPPHH